MADKRLAEQNKRWLQGVHSHLVDAQAAIISELSDCERDTPDVNWERIEGNISKALNFAKMAVQRTSKEFTK